MHKKIGYISKKKKKKKERKERNKCVEILMNVKKEYYSILYVKDVTDNKTIF